MDNWEFAELFLEHLKFKGFTFRTIETYRGKLNRFLEYLAVRQKKIPELTASDLADYRNTLYYQEYRGKSLSIETQYLQLTILRVFFKFIAVENLILINPAAALELPKRPQGLPRTILSAREANKILEAIDTREPMGLRDRAILELLYSSGIRVTELIKLTVTDLDFDQGLLRIETGKGGKTRVVPMGEIACIYAKEYLKKARPKTEQLTFFLSFRQKLPLDRSSIAELCIRRALQAGIKKKITPHAWRHTCATLMLKSGADIRYIQELLGHASLRTTQIYTKVTVQDLKKVHARCHPREKERF
jgi:integrase/recombinase XerD